MYTSAALLDIHDRAHQSLTKLIDHCAGFSRDELKKEIEGFGYPSIRLQLHHVITGEQYWVGVLHEELLLEELERDYESIEAIRSFHHRVMKVTREYLTGASEAELNTRRTMATWRDPKVDLIPGQIIIRTQTHMYQHQGQVAAMCRLLGRPIPAGLDFPLTESPR